MRIQALTIFFLLVTVTNAAAQTRYVSDELTITLRTGPSTRNQITENLTSGDAVDVLEELPEEGYTRVRVLSSGVEGWVISRYLVPDLIAADRLVNAERDLVAAKRRVSELEAANGELNADLSGARERLETTQATNSEISTELSDIRNAAANAVALRDQNESLRRRVNELTAETDQLQITNAELTSRNRQNWFVVGAAVLLGGIVIGLIAPSLRPKRKTAW
jgi:SH3 domain protein